VLLCLYSYNLYIGFLEI